jgi:hypothetical protein
MGKVLRERRPSELALVAASACVPEAVLHFFGSKEIYPPSWVHFAELALGLLCDEVGQSFDPSCVAALEVLLAHSRQGPGITPIAA